MSRMFRRLLALTLILFCSPWVLPCVAAQAAGPRQADLSTKPEPPVMTKINQYMVFVQLADGRLMGILGSPVDGVAMARYSTDGGYTWGNNRSLFRFPVGQGVWTIENAFLGQDGEVHLVCHNFPEKQPASLYQMTYDIWSVRSMNGIAKWDSPKLVWKGYSGSLLSVTQLRNGRILIPFCYLTPRTWAHRGSGPDAFTFMGRFSSTVAYSDDDGYSWHVSPEELKEQTPYIGADGGIEPIAIQLKDGRVWLLIRTQDNYFFQSFSKDGSVWSSPQPTELISSDSPAALLRLKDGRIIMLWNNTQRYSYANGGRAVLHGAVSSNDGNTWRGYREVARDPLVVNPPPPNGDYGVSYSVPALTQGGDVITSLSTGPGGGEYVLHVDPNWLDATHQHDDFSSGLTQWSTFGTKGVALVANPEKPGSECMEIRKASPDWAAAGVWNFPMGRRGTLRLRLLLRPNFQGGRIGITDHFSVPFDPLDVNYNLYNFWIGAGGKIAGGGQVIKPGQWHNLEIKWDCDRGRASVSCDNRVIAVLHQSRMTAGASYLRIVSTAQSPHDAGLLIGSVDADVSSSWSSEQ
jgi:hypothetical protein